MCWSIEVSIGTFIFSIGVSLYLAFIRVNPNDTWHAIFLGSFSSMQLLEAFLWNDLSSCAGHFTWPLVLFLPLACSIGRDIENRRIHLETFYTLLFFISGLFSLSSDYLLYDAETTVGPGGHLIWRKIGINTTSIIFVSYMQAMTIPYRYMKPYGTLFTLSGLLSAAAAWVITENDEYASFWCHISNLYSLLALYFSKNKVDHVD